MSGVRYPLMGLAMLGLVLGLWAGLVRSGLPVPEAGAPAPLAHGPLMVSCFLGTLIALERALAVRSLASWLAPALSGASVLALLPGYYRAAAALAVLAAVTAVGVHLRVRRRNPTPPLTLMTLGAAAWGAGNLLWLFAWAIPRVVPFWVVFLTLTVWGERLELSRFVLKEGRRLLFHSATVLLMAGAGLSLIRYQSGVRMMGAGLLTGVLWLLGRDLYRHTLRRPGQPGFTALSVLLGLLWLLGAGVGWLVLGGPAAGPRYDALLHSVFVGFVFSMIFAHAPVLAPLISGRPVPFSALLYLPLGLLHASLALRVFSDLAGWWQERAWGESIAGVWLTLERWGAAGNVAAIALFLLLIVLTLTRPPKPRTTLGSDPQISIFPRIW